MKVVGGCGEDSRSWSCHQRSRGQQGEGLLGGGQPSDRNKGGRVRITLSLLLCLQSMILHLLLLLV